MQAGLSGLSFDEGTFGVFGYVTSGMDNVAKLQTGDVIRSAQLVAGKERLVVPPQQEQQAPVPAPALD
jgi:cyclophilin family peptidyl-prolyl cis-trans isomerase